MTSSVSDTSTMVPTAVGQLHVRTVGNGPPALLWHSLFVDSSSWERVLVPLAQQRTLVVVDGPSHGGSEPATQLFTLDDCATAAGQILDHLDVAQPVDWVGNAWGGHVGIVVAATQPARIRSLVTIGTPAAALTARERRNIRPLVTLYRALGPVTPLVKGVQQALLGKGPDSADASIVSHALRNADRRGMHVAMRSIMLNRPSLLPLLPAIAAPTLVVTVKDDAYDPLAAARDAAHQIPNCEVLELPGQGHLSPLLQTPGDLTEALTRFWQ